MDLRELSEAEKDKCIMLSLVMWNLQNKANEWEFPSWLSGNKPDSYP